MVAAYDLVSLGEPLLRLAPPKFERIRRGRRFDVEVVGSQLNVAADLARLGKKTAFLSQLPDNELGRLARDVIRSYGTDVRYLTSIPDSRMGVVYVEFSVTPRTGTSVYDRQGSAASTMTGESFPWDEILTGTQIAYTDGILPGLSQGCRDAALAFLGTARRRNCTTAFDVNYREHLWTPEQARAAWTPLLELVDIVATNRSVSEQVFGFSGTDRDIMRRYRDRFGSRVVCLTAREVPSVLHNAWTSQALYGDQWLEGPRMEFDIVDRFGTGDAWFAGFLYGYLERDVQYGLEFGNALCALAHTTEGDVVQSSPSEVESLLRGNDLRLRR